MNEQKKDEFIKKYGDIGFNVLKAYRFDNKNVKANLVLWIWSKITGRKQYREDIKRKIKEIWE